MPMEKYELQKYLGMAVDLVYYHFSQLYKEETFEKDYCDELRNNDNREYWVKVYQCLKYALQQEDYCLSIVKSPMKERYKEADIRLFFEKFYVFLERCVLPE